MDLPPHQCGQDSQVAEDISFASLVSSQARCHRALPSRSYSSFQLDWAVFFRKLAAPCAGYPITPLAVPENIVSHAG